MKSKTTEATTRTYTGNLETTEVEPPYGGFSRLGMKDLAEWIKLRKDYPRWAELVKKGKKVLARKKEQAKYMKGNRPPQTKYKYTIAKQVGGDDGYQWAVIDKRSGHTFINGLTKPEVKHYRDKAEADLAKKYGVTESQINEGSYRGDLQRLVGPELHIDQHRSKMGEDDDIIVVSFKVQGKEPANDLVSFLETGYDFILDADASPGEISPGRFLVFFEISRRTTAVDRIYQIVEEVLNLTLQDMDEWRFAYGPPEEKGSRRRIETFAFNKENLEKMIPMSPRQYREANEKFEEEVVEPVTEPQIDFVEPTAEPTSQLPAQDTDDIAAMKNIAGIPVNQQAPDDEEMNSLRQQAGLI